MSESLTKLKQDLDDRSISYKEDHELARYTTWKVGGPADIFVTTYTNDDLQFIIKSAIKNTIPYTILGGGSNVLISDNGIRGIVIRNMARNITIANTIYKQPKTPNEKVLQARLVQVHKEDYYSFEDLDFDESHYPTIQVQADSGVYLAYLIHFLINKGVTGLQWFSGIPGTLGGAVFNNIHGGSHFFSEYVNIVTALNAKGEIVKYFNNDLNFDYDYSIFHKNDDVILTVDLILRKGDKEKAQKASMAWTDRKRLQPSNSAGCCFQNIDIETQEKLNVESNSWGYIIDKILNLKGYKIGGAHISEKHAAFIETVPPVKASDILEIFDKVYLESKKRLGIVPKPEIFFLGFKPSEVSKYL